MYGTCFKELVDMCDENKANKKNGLLPKKGEYRGSPYLSQMVFCV